MAVLQTEHQRKQKHNKVTGNAGESSMKRRCTNTAQLSDHTGQTQFLYSWNNPRGAAEVRWLFFFFLYSRFKEWEQTHNGRRWVAKHPDTKAFTSCSAFKRLNNNKHIQLHKSEEAGEEVCVCVCVCVCDHPSYNISQHYHQEDLVNLCPLRFWHRYIGGCWVNLKREKVTWQLTLAGGLWSITQQPSAENNCL